MHVLYEVQKSCSEPQSITSLQQHQLLSLELLIVGAHSETVEFEMYHNISDFHDALNRIEIERTPFRSSSSSTISPSGAAATSSKAVLSALRALQDKIRRLDAETMEATEEAAQLRIQIRNHEMESDRFKQRDTLASQKNLHEVRAAYERILTEKCETETRLLKLEERNRGEEKISTDLRAKISAVEDEKYSGLIIIKDLESRRSQLQSHILHSREKEKGTCSDYVVSGCLHMMLLILFS